MAIQADISWREQYVSHALNRKFTGIIPIGVYQGFACTVDAAGAVTVGNDGVAGVAVAEVNGYSVTVRMDAPETVQTAPAAPYVVLVPYYAIGVATRVDLQAVATPESHHLILTKAVQGSDGAWQLDDSERQVATWRTADSETLAQMASAQVETMERQLALQERVYALEQASTTG